MAGFEPICESYMTAFDVFVSPGLNPFSISIHEFSDRVSSCCPVVVVGNSHLSSRSPGIIDSFRIRLREEFVTALF